MRWIGVVGDVEPGQMLAGLDHFPRFQSYVPAVQSTPQGMEISRFPTFVVATGGDLDTLTSTVKSEVAALDPTLPAFELLSMHTVLDRFYFAQKIWSHMFSAIAFLALVIAAVGAYGVTAYSVSQRLRELGIRLALGAERGPLLRLVMRQGGLAGRSRGGYRAGRGHPDGTNHAQPPTRHARPRPGRLRHRRLPPAGGGCGSQLRTGLARRPHGSTARAAYRINPRLFPTAPGRRPSVDACRIFPRSGRISDG